MCNVPESVTMSLAKYEAMKAEIQALKTGYANGIKVEHRNWADDSGKSFSIRIEPTPGTMIYDAIIEMAKRACGTGIEIAFENLAFYEWDVKNTAYKEPVVNIFPEETEKETESEEDK